MLKDMFATLLLKLITPSRLASLVRKGLMFLGGMLVTKGWLTEGDWVNLSAALASIIIPVVWGWLEKGVIERFIRAAVQAPPDTTVAEVQELVLLKQRNGL